MTTAVPFRPRLGRLQGCHSDLGWGDYRGVIQTLAGATTGTSHSDLGWGDYRGVIQTLAGATTGTSHSDLGWGDYRGAIQT